jgi:hypothetical protein
VAGSAPRTDATAAPHVGDVIDGRYQLEAPLSIHRALTSADGGMLWRAADLVLSRPVAIRILSGSDPDVRRAFLRAAATSCRMTDPLVAATYDAAEFPLGASGTDAAYIVREWIEGETLYETLRTGQLAPERATAIVHDVALALAHLHQAGVAHGQVHPANVLLREDGQVRLTDAAVGLALEPAPRADAFADDTDALGKTLYVALTGRWPGGPWRELPAAPPGRTDPDRPLTARQVRAGVSRELDAVTSAVLRLDPRMEHAAPSSAAAVATALGALPVHTGAPTAPPPPSQLPPPTTRQPMSVRRRRIFLGASLIAFALITLFVVQLVGVTPGGSPSVPAFRPPGTSAGSPGSGQAVPIVAAHSFDPPPGDGSENDGDLRFAYDGQATTAWQTQTYTTARLGNAKPGVGILLDLGSPKSIAEVRLTFGRPGTDVDIRAMSPNATVAGSSLADFPLVARALDTPSAITLRANATSRFWLVWLTKLPPSGKGFRGSIAEVVLAS